MQRAVIIPTGDEILQGIVLDTNSPEIMSQILHFYPACCVCRATPVVDQEDAIIREIDAWVQRGVDCIMLIGGSGGGHRYSSTLSFDFTHSALEEYLTEKNSTEIYGKNGHMWSKLICGKKDNALIVNLPGPFVEAKAAITAFLIEFQRDPLDMKSINSAMAKKVMEQYGTSI